VAAALAVAIAVGIGAAAAVNELRSHGSPGRAVAATERLAGRGLVGQATWPAGARPAPAITTLRDVSGKPFALTSLRGHTVALVFFDSHCNQECPLEGRALTAAERAVPARDRPVVVAVSVNPRDTAASVRRAVTAWGLARAGSWHWLVGPRSRLAPVWRAYRIFVGRPVHGDIPHTEALYLIGPGGDERSGYLYPFLPRSVAHDLRVLGRGSTGRRARG
jgi:protein SCO1/2